MIGINNKLHFWENTQSCNSAFEFCFKRLLQPCKYIISWSSRLMFSCFVFVMILNCWIYNLNFDKYSKTLINEGWLLKVIFVKLEFKEWVIILRSVERETNYKLPTIHNIILWITKLTLLNAWWKCFHFQGCLKSWKQMSRLFNAHSIHSKMETAKSFN